MLPHVEQHPRLFESGIVEVCAVPLELVVGLVSIAKSMGPPLFQKHGTTFDVEMMLR